MSEDKKDEKKDHATDFSDYARHRPNSPPPGSDQEERAWRGKVLRGCGIALGIAALVFLFIVGACFISMSR